MPYKKHSLTGIDAAQKPPLAPLSGGELAKRSRVEAVLRSQDKIVGLSRRIVMAQSLAGSHSFATPETDPDVMGAQTHPLNGEARVVHRARVDVTPGCFLRLTAAYLPSGKSQLEVNPGSDYDDGGNGASLRLDVTWTDQDGNTLATETNVPLVGAGGEFAPEPANTWASVKTVIASLIVPDTISESDAELARWTRHVHAEVTLHHLGGARVIDAVVSEVPYALAREEGVDPPDQWVSNLWADGHPDGPAAPLEWPLESVYARMSDVANAQRLRFGPTLIDWTAWNEGSADVTSTEIPEVTISSTNLTRVFDQVETGWDPDGPGWSLCNYARGYAENHPYWSENNGVIPVRINVYGATENIGAVAEVRIQSAPYSWGLVRIDSREPQWWSGIAHLSCGTGPGDDRVCQALAQMISGVGGVRIRAINVVRQGRYYPAA